MTFGIKTDELKAKIICIFFIILIITYCVGCDTKPPCINCGKQNNIDTIAEHLNKRLTYTQIVKKDYPSLCSETKNTYEITLRPDIILDTYYFKDHQYVIETGGDFSLMNVTNTCKLIDSIRLNKDKKIIDLIKEIDIKANLKVFSVDIELQKLQYIFAEIYAIIGILSNDIEIEMYLKGYADGYRNKWKRAFDKNARYHYRSIEYHPTTDEGSLNPLNYDRNNKSSHKLDSDFYYNKDLPLLRAQFIKDDFIEPFTKKCAKKVKGIYVLEGYEFSQDTINPYKRKVQVFFSEICTK